jgi:hypothetical protein
MEQNLTAVAIAPEPDTYLSDHKPASSAYCSMRGRHERYTMSVCPAAGDGNPPEPTNLLTSLREMNGASRHLHHLIVYHRGAERCMRKSVFFFLDCA